MSRYIDADALMERFAEMQKVNPDKDGQGYACNFLNMGGEPSAEWFTVEDAVENAPTVDVVQVVRCGECKYFYGQETINGIKAGKCKMWQMCAMPNYGLMRADHYCADGKRKDGKENE